MAIENSAFEAPQWSIVPKPTGFRRMTPGLLKADRSAEKFTGFPESVKAYGQLLAAFKAAAPRLGISARVTHAVDFLFSFTKSQDWQPDSRPIVWPSNETLRTALGLERSQIKDIIRRLIELGLITMKDSPNGKRYGHRHPNNETGRITEAYGFDLSLFAVRHAEFVRLAEEHQAERRAMKKLRRRRTIAHKGIIQILETAQEYGFEPEEWEILARETRDLTRALKDLDRVDEMETGVASLERHWQGARARIEVLLGTVDSDPKEPENRPHYYNYNQTSNLEEDTVIAAKGCSKVRAAPSFPPSEPVSQSSKVQDPVSWQVPQRDPRGLVDRICADEMCRLVPALRKYLFRPDPDWRDIVNAADWLRADLGVSKSAWADACIKMGRERAAIAIALVTTKEPGHVKNPGGYFRSMLRYDLKGELHLDQSIWGLRRANNSERARNRHHEASAGSEDRL
jgi:replication initiation protein RepC